MLQSSSLNETRAVAIQKCDHDTSWHERSKQQNMRSMTPFHVIFKKSSCICIRLWKHTHQTSKRAGMTSGCETGKCGDDTDLVLLPELLMNVYYLCERQNGNPAPPFPPPRSPRSSEWGRARADLTVLSKATST